MIAIDVRGVIRATIEELRASDNTGMVENLLTADAAVGDLIHLAKMVETANRINRWGGSCTYIVHEAHRCIAQFGGAA